MKAVAIIALFAVFGASSALKCYVCNSEADSACIDPFSADSPSLTNAFLTNCPAKPEGEAFCRKTKMWFEVNGEVRVHRDCAYMRRENYTCYQQRAEDHVVDVCQCDEEACNSAPAAFSSITTVVLMLCGALLRQ